MIDSVVMKRVRAPQKKVIMVIGAADSGKTTIVWSIAKSLRGHYRTAIADLDMGQSHIGPPTTIGWAMMEDHIEDWSEIKARDFYFTGTVTPFGSLLPAIAGAKIITERASVSADKVIIDTTGLISEPVGRVLKHYKIDIIDPDLILAIESSDELSHILDPFMINVRPEIIRIPVHPETRIKTPMRRAEYRFKRMMDYLKEAEVIALHVEKIKIRFIRNPLSSKEEFINRVVSLRDRSNRDIGIGVIRDLVGGTIRVLTPLKDSGAISSIVIGRTVFDSKERTLKDS